MASSSPSLDTIVSLCKRRGFVYQTAEIYSGLNGVYDFGPMGTLVKQNIQQVWQQSLQKMPLDVVFLDGAILGPPALWQASGHVDHFSDPMVDCTNCKKRFRTDDGSINLEKSCPSCGVQAWTAVRQFNMMFQTNLGAAQDDASIAYLRPETAQAVFVNFKNVMSTTRVKIPFGIAQIGKAFRNEITPKQFLFRMREFEQMELEWFCTAGTAPDHFTQWCERRRLFYQTLGINMNKIRLRDHDQSELAHYSVSCTDVEYEFPFGWKELEGIANRGTYDLTQHSKHSGKDLSVHDPQTKDSYIPTVIECSVGIERLFLTILFDAYTEDIIDGESRIVLKISPQIAPIKAAFLPLMKKLSEPMGRIFYDVKKTGLSVQFDETGSIGKRYRRQDEIGTPLCFTYDFESETDNSVTVRHRDTTKQERIAIDQIPRYLADALKTI